MPPANGARERTVIIITVKLGLLPGAATEQLDVKINGISEEDHEDFNVIVVQEHSMVFYDEEGNLVYDWTVTTDDGEVQE